MAYGFDEYVQTLFCSVGHIYGKLSEFQSNNEN